MKTLRYIPQLNTITGSINATLLLLQLEFWFETTNGKPFFKFLEACPHDAYQLGDSWVEELGFTKAEFRHAFSQIGTSYKSKTAYLKSTDPFKGKLYLSYFDRIRKLTLYVRNDEAVENLFATKLPSNNATSSQALPTPTTTPSTDSEFTCGISRDYLHKSLQRKDQETTPYHKVLEAFHSLCPHLEPITKLTKKREKALDQLWNHVHANLAAICDTFKSVTTNDFLSGRLAHKNWKASFDWIIQLSSFEKILQNYYAPRSTIKPNKFNNMYSHEWDFDKPAELEDDYITRQIAAFHV